MFFSFLMIRPSGFHMTKGGYTRRDERDSATYRPFTVSPPAEARTKTRRAHPQPSVHGSETDSDSRLAPPQAARFAGMIRSTLWEGPSLPSPGQRVNHKKEHPEQQGTMDARWLMGVIQELRKLQSKPGGHPDIPRSRLDPDYYH